MEKWKDIKGYEGLYQVSTYGNVKRVDTNNFLKPQKTSPGYYKVSLSKNGKVSQIQIHRLVAKAFIPNPDNLPIINHKDECKINNRVENLEWCTQKYNLNYGNVKNRIAEKVSKNTIFTTKNPNPPKQVYQYNLNNELITIYPSVGNVAKTLGYKQQTISRHCRKQDIYKGHKWSYIPL